MAQTFATLIAAAVKKYYSDTSLTGATITPMSVNAYKNSFGSKYNAMGRSGKMTFEVQRAKRIKSKDVDATGTTVEQLTKRINAASELSWETVSFTPGKKRDFLIKIEKNEEFDFTNVASDFTSRIDSGVENQLITSEEDAILNIVNDADVAKVSLGDLTALSFADAGKKIMDSLSLKSLDVNQLVDDFGHFADTGLHVSPYAAIALKNYKGEVFNVDKSGYADSIVPDFTLSNRDFGLVNTHFDKFANLGTANDEKILAIVMTSESYFDAGLDSGKAKISNKILDVDFQGFSFYGAGSVIDAKRIVVITGKTPTATVKKVNA